MTTHYSSTKNGSLTGVCAGTRTSARGAVARKFQGIPDETEAASFNLDTVMAKLSPTKD